jgi:hypothetical protein
LRRQSYWSSIGIRQTGYRIITTSNHEIYVRSTAVQELETWSCRMQ